MAKARARDRKRRPSCEHAGRLITAQLQPLQPGRHHYRGADAFQLAPHLSSLSGRRTPPRLPLQPRQAEQMKSVITLDLWLNRLWQRCKVGNEIGLRACISVFEDKSSVGKACALQPPRCRDGGITPAYTMPSVDVRNGSHLVPVGQRVSFS